ncbi:unnamed protein product [Bursaphelenchus xylophilus]|uniref:(pine wood nematode) hypothetical protein n=1 Tax=Bursaphelenchus xylophilus TaxID=6326 RepID=A0A1I7S0Z1_BURXY|nr:unnamed protein product [Bursaphelenchus xylophilus]CAG9087907.1 unnamed protein product [Bursaphelenchus xylophilus]
MSLVSEKLANLNLAEEILSTKLSDSGFDGKWLLETLLRPNGNFDGEFDFWKLNKITTFDIGAGKGHLSRVYLVSLGSSSGQELDLVIKVPTIAILNAIRAHTGQETFQDDSPGAQFVYASHNRECEYYEMVKSQPSNKTHTPKAHYIKKVGSNPTEDRGVLILHSFAKNSVSLPLFQGASKGMMISVAKALADLHATCLNLEGQPWKDLNNTPLQTDYLALSVTPRYLPVLKVKCPYVYEAFLPLRSLVNPKFLKYCLVDRAVEMNAIGFVYGDCWGNNTLFEKRADGSVSDEVSGFVDLQMVGWGNGLFDLARFITTCVDAETRRESADEAFTTYYNNLKSQVKEAVPKTIEEARELFDLATIHQAIYYVFLIPAFMLSSSRTAPSPQVHEARMEKLKLRGKLAMQDAVKMVEKYDLKRFESPA